MREINRIILHCAATIEGGHYDVETIRRWHVEDKNYTDIGYHYVIYLDGSIHVGRSLDVAGAHTRGHNHDSIGVCYVGGLDIDGNPKDTMTPMQDVAVIHLVKSLRLILGRHLKVYGHNDFAKKACPCFNVESKYNFLNQQHGISN